MLRSILAFGLAGFLALGAVSGSRADDEKKSDKDTKVDEGKEFKLTPVEITASEKPDEQGRFEATIKAKESTTVKMPKEGWWLGFYPKTVKGGGVGVEETIDGTGIKQMRTVAGKEKDEGAWQADPDDVITHVNGYAVNSVEEVICAVSLAKNKNDVQVIIKDVTTGKPTIFYVTATKR